MQGDNPATIFIVDDDDAVRAALRLLIRSFGWHAIAYPSGKALLDALPILAADCILLDLDMPQMRGSEVQVALAARKIKVPIIIVTGRDDALLPITRLRDVVGVLHKPVQDRELKRLIEQALKAPPANSEA